MGKIILDDNYIKSLPITTNRIEVSWDKDKFFAKYSIVSYYSTDPERKNLAYEQLGNVPFISVTGIKNRWGAQHFPSVNPEKPDVPLNKNDAFQKVQKRRVQEKR